VAVDLASRTWLNTVSDVESNGRVLIDVTSCNSMYLLFPSNVSIGSIKLLMGVKLSSMLCDAFMSKKISAGSRS
jgi:hypothetical protein